MARDVFPALTYVSDRDPGILRRRAGRGFCYRQDGAAVPQAEVARIRGLGIPPAWTGVWICPDPSGHIQATGLDARGRKQYRYHPLWSALRGETKFAGLPAFGAALPGLRARIARDLGGEVGDLAFTRAALVLLMDQAFLRIGNEAYTAANRTFGATTLLARHLTVADGAVRLRFRAKGGREVRLSLKGRRLVRVFEAIGDLPGRNLFTWIDEDGAVRRVGSQDVNAWLAEATGAPATAKTFRTWGGTLAAFEAALAAGGRLTVKVMAVAAAERLHNTPTIARKSYVHPAVLGLAGMDAGERAERLAALDAAPVAGLRGEEPRLLGFLKTPSPETPSRA